MLKKSIVGKITKSKDYKQVYKCSEFRFSEQGFLLLKLKNDLLENTSRYGIVASCKIGKAVIRNFWKRHLRVWFSQILEKDSSGNDYVIILNKQINMMEPQEVYNKLSKAIMVLKKQEFFKKNK